MREPGERAKVAVESYDDRIDPVGACVGMKGMRVQSIIRELRGEKIDIIEFSEDPVLYVTKALSPAKISRVTILDGTDKHMEVVVDDLQLSLAIGKRGQNVRLAAKLIGWKIDIKSEEEKRRELESRMGDLVISGAPVSVLMDHGMPESVVEQLVGAGIGTVERLGGMTPEELEAIPGVDEELVTRIQTSVVAFYSQYDAEQQNEESSETETEEAPADPEAIEAAIDNEGSGHHAAFRNIETGVLEHDLAKHEQVLLEETKEGEVLDLGKVEGLSAAPSQLRGLAHSRTVGAPDSADGARGCKCQCFHHIRYSKSTRY